ncbi:transcription initiation factor TFIID subunit 4b-like isoform X2 [Diospyros lotus]|uniref:transcription initiation factor TFIID subunit 4b-like isoform X2 n=1 Tax=Diospyros lotus TaxID=55363 RepID=UPI002250A9D8|nr:transcription initiation factor TFIID subunit 4b-like isoform X2 [Diospyros lotus]
MDPSIMKLLEEDEDETMHSGADVEAFTAALNRDIEGNTSTSQHSDSLSVPLSQGSHHTSSQVFPQWQTFSQVESANGQNQQNPNGFQQQEQHMSEMELKQHDSGPEKQQQQLESSEELNSNPFKQEQLQEDCQPQKVEQNTVHFSQTTGVQNSEKNPVRVREPDRTHNLESESQHLNFQKMKGHQTIASEQGMNSVNRGKQMPFALLLPVIQTQLDKDRAMQLETLYLKLKKNEIAKDGFVRHMRSIVGDQMLKMAIYKLQAQAQASARPQQLKMPSVGVNQGAVRQSFSQPHQKGITSEDVSYVPSSTAQLSTHSSNAKMDDNGQKSQEMAHQLDLHGMPSSQMSSSNLSNINQEKERSTMPIHGLSKQQSQHLQFSQTSFPAYGSTGVNYHPLSGTKDNASTSSLKNQPHDSQLMQGPVYQSTGAERQHSFIEPKRVHGGSGTLPHLTGSSSFPHNSPHWQSSSGKEQKSGAPSISYVKQEPLDQGAEQQNTSQVSSPGGPSSLPSLPGERVNAPTGISNDKSLEMQSSRMGFSTSMSTVAPNSALASMSMQLEPNISLNSRIPSPAGAGNSTKTPVKKPSIGQKKPLESLGSSPPLPSKKQKISGAFSDQSIEQLNDVTAVSGVNLREEEEQLFSGPKEDSRISEASRRVVQEEEERLILQKNPLKKKLAEIMSRCGIKNVSNDAERCLSLCVEERIRGLLSNLVRLSKQRIDIEKRRHRTLVISDVRQQIMAINRKAREEWERKQAESGKLEKQSEQEGNAGVDVSKEKDEGRAKALKGNKEEDDKMRATAANVAARAAVGGDDMLSKWQLMAEQARQKREGGIDAASGSQQVNDVSRKPPLTREQNAADNQEAEQSGQPSAGQPTGLSGKFTRNQGAVVPPSKQVRSICMKDVIAVLEREPQMSKTPLVYILYEKAGADDDAVAE